MLAVGKLVMVTDAVAVIAAQFPEEVVVYVTT
jgi:hypothetical protein